MKGFYNLGITETQSPQGAVIRLYDKERCLCDLIKDRSQIEKQLYVRQSGIISKVSRISVNC